MRKWCRALELGHKPLDLGIVKDRAISLVADKSRAPIRKESCDDFTRNVDLFRFHASSPSNLIIDLIPREPLIGRDMECLSNFSTIAE